MLHMPHKGARLKKPPLRSVTLSADWRSSCPLNASVEILGDRWSLLIIRDMMLRGFCSFKQFLDSYERIATNILADRLHKLESHGIIAAETHPDDGRKVLYSLTAKGMDLAPILTEMVLWAAAHEDVKNQALVSEIKKDKQKFLEAVRKRWEARNRERAVERSAGELQPG
jgi:DNA-binding HxlR family transcriptional regulator